MRSVLLISLLFCVAASLSTKKYIVVFHKNTTDIQQANHVGRLQENVYNSFAIGEDFRAFAAHLTPQQVVDELASGEVNYIEEDGVVHAYQSCKVQSAATWGLNRISEQDIELTGDYRYSLDGAGVTAFIIDTGILTTHKEFTGRVEWGINTVGDGVNNDCNGHGTHVAGTVGGTTYGVAKKVSLVAVKVLGCTGSGTNAGVIQGIQYAASSKRRPAVANMSLGGGYSKATNDAVAAGVKAGVTFVVAAGNENADACNSSPASEATAITVGATDVNDQNLNDQFDTRSTFSNYGSCVKIFAPGTLITSAWYKSDTSINTISGTSMASPHVAGVAAQYLGNNPSATPASVRSALVNGATSGAIQLLCSTTSCKASPNLLLYSSC